MRLYRQLYEIRSPIRLSKERVFPPPSLSSLGVFLIRMLINEWWIMDDRTERILKEIYKRFEFQLIERFQFLCRYIRSFEYSITYSCIPSCICIYEMGFYRIIAYLFMCFYYCVSCVRTVYRFSIFYLCLCEKKKKRKLWTTIFSKTLENFIGRSG